MGPQAVIICGVEDEEAFVQIPHFVRDDRTADAENDSKKHSS